VFGALMMEREPLPWMTDLIFHDVLRTMRRTSSPVLSGIVEGDDRRWAEEILTITTVGRSVLAGRWTGFRSPLRLAGWEVC